MESPEERRRRLYGPSRNLLVEDIRHRLSKSSVLKDGEYNYTVKKLKDDVFDTSYQRNFLGRVLDPSSLQEQKGHLGHHFELGNDSGAQIPTVTYQQSTTKDDFPAQEYSKPDPITADRVINWPDMAPRFMISRKLADSEYKSNYVPEMVQSTASHPVYPRVNTSIMKLPLDPERFWRQRNTNIVFGSDRPQIFSEHQRVYGIGREGVPDVFTRDSQDSTKAVRKSMKDMEKVSHVFRQGDYDGIVGKFQTTVNDEFGPRTLPPGEHAARALKAQDMKKEKSDSDDSGVESSGSTESLPEDKSRTNQLASYARQTTVPKVFKDAEDGKTYQTSAHFQFGSDPNTIHTVYGKDYIPGPTKAYGPPQKSLVPDAGKLLQNDPAYSGVAPTSAQVDFTYTPALPSTLIRYARASTKYTDFVLRAKRLSDKLLSQGYVCYRLTSSLRKFYGRYGELVIHYDVPLSRMNEEGKTQLEVNIERRRTNNIIMSMDETRHAEDRMASLAHSDYIGPPRGYRPMQPVGRPRVEFDYLTPNDALPYPGLENRTSEAKNNYIGTFMSGGHAMDRRKNKDSMCKQRLNDGRSTHFIVGYNPMDFTSETQMKYQGDPKTDGGIPAAGKTENVSKSKYKHVSMSENTQDLKAADPYAVSKHESLMARAAHRQPDKEHAFTTSVMKSDFNPLYRRAFTNAQLRMMDDTDKKMMKTIASSHLFHTDNSGRNNFVTTQMDDFIKPETMTGRKFLTAL